MAIPKLLYGCEGWILTARQNKSIGSYEHAFPASYARILSTDVMKVYERTTNRWNNFKN
jgi:hypothetical protein